MTGAEAQYLQMMGMNAIWLFFWHGTAETLINAIYIQHEGSDTKLNLLDWVQYKLFARACSAHTEIGVIESPCQLLYVFAKIGCFAAACLYLAPGGFSGRFRWQIV